MVMIPAAVIGQAEGMMNTACNMVSLRVPANAPDREGLVNEAALTICLNGVVDAARPGARTLHAMMHLAVLRGRGAGMEFSEIMESLHEALKDAIQARIEEEAEGETRTLGPANG